jgi:hypothetical protein
VWRQHGRPDAGPGRHHRDRLAQPGHEHRLLAGMYTSADVMQRSGSSRLEPKGALPFALAFVYGAEGNANASRSIVFPFVVTVTDDRGNHVTGLVQWTAN